ncbi:MAG: hypothetical protein OEM46_00655 [Ignavibacteria bacterium]|nr:hypothetical protein [Ignavibacteria bacterium]
MPKGLSPVQRTIRELNSQGIVCGIVERWIPYAKKPGFDGPPGVRKDLFDIIDIIALSERGVIGVQCCGSDFSSHIQKITIEKAQETYEWLRTPGTQMELWAWRKVKLERGGKAMRWRPRLAQFRLENGKIIYNEYQPEGIAKAESKLF